MRHLPPQEARAGGCARLPLFKDLPRSLSPCAMTAPLPPSLFCCCVLPFLFCTLCSRPRWGLRVVAVTLGALLCDSAGRWVRDGLGR